MKRVAFVAAALLGCNDAESVEPIESERPSQVFGEEDCAGCHPSAAAQWADSRHHSAFTNADFQRSYAREPDPFCRDCHAPGTKAASAEEASSAEARGIGCGECHGEGRAIETGLGRSVDAPHAIQRSAGFGTEVCARCHEFEFPESSRRPAGLLMQSTMSEHRASKFADRSCASCHFARSGGGIDHSLASTRDPEAWRRALAVAARAEGNAVIFSLRPVEAGHALPTGDLFRRLALYVAHEVDGTIVASSTRYLARHFEPWRHPDGRLNEAYAWPVRDDRPQDRTEVSIVLEGEERDNTGEWIWWVDYERVDAREEERPHAATIASSVRIAGGRISR